MLVGAMLLTSTPVAFGFAWQYKVKQLITDGKKPIEIDSSLLLNRNNVVVVPKKKKLKEKGREFSYEAIKGAEYSFGKKPLLSKRKAMLSAVVLGVWVVPLLFMKKENHWLSIQNGDEFVVLRLDEANYRPIIAELEAHGVEVTFVDEENGNKTDEKF